VTMTVAEPNRSGMNVVDWRAPEEGRPDLAKLWTLPRMREAVKARDFTALYREMQRHGYRSKQSRR
jgi:hypothetical protein